MPATCSHLDTIDESLPRDRGEGCTECLKIGSRWVHLRQCMQCGEVACCDDSPMRHATAHNHATGHPIIRSLEPGEYWYWCYADRIAFELDPSA
jgi:Zn-finger in ubiquitin-hydrolases and other protein